MLINLMHLSFSDSACCQLTSLTMAHSVQERHIPGLQLVQLQPVQPLLSQHQRVDICLPFQRVANAYSPALLCEMWTYLAWLGDDVPFMLLCVVSIRFRDVVTI